MQTNRLFDTIDSLYEEYVSLWEALCNIESPINCKEGVDRSSDLLIAIAEKHGWRIEISHQDVAGNAVAITMNQDAKKKPFCLSAHMDTVHPIGAFGTPAVRIDGEKILGPGVTDCKGGAVAALLAMDALEKCGFTDRPVMLLLQSDEEVGSSLSKKATIDFICEKAKDAVAFFNLEGATKGEACLIRKGIVTFTFTVTGIEAHSSMCATKGANAILEAAHKIIELEKFKDKDGLTCCCSVISGGTVSNTVPGRCAFKANVRFATAEQLAMITEYMQEIADKVYVEGCHTEVNHPSYRPAMEDTERNRALLARVNAICADIGLPELKAIARKGGSDAAYVTLAKIPCLDSLGVEGGAIHSPNEFAYLDSLKESARRIAAVASAI